LCETCSKAHIEKGYRESEEIVFCTATWYEHQVPFRVRQCSGYQEIKRQTLKQMEDIAWDIPADGRKRTAGFVPATESISDDDDAALILNRQE
jgi:hypothetical protein